MDSDRLRQVWGKFPTGVTIISSLDADGEVHSMTANAVCSVSLEPPLCLVCVSHTRHSHQNILERKVFSVSFLHQDQEDIARYFALDHEKRSGDVNPEYQFTYDGVPMLKECIAYLACRVESQHDAGDHTIFVARVTEAGVSQEAPDPALVFYDSRFTSVRDN